jgi:hypothetical protein
MLPDDPKPANTDHEATADFFDRKLNAAPEDTRPFVGRVRS